MKLTDIVVMANREGQDELLARALYIIKNLGYDLDVVVGSMEDLEAIAKAVENLKVQVRELTKERDFAVEIERQAGNNSSALISNLRDEISELKKQKDNIVARDNIAATLIPELRQEVQALTIRKNGLVLDVDKFKTEVDRLTTENKALKDAEKASWQTIDILKVRNDEIGQLKQEVLYLRQSGDEQASRVDAFRSENQRLVADNAKLAEEVKRKQKVIDMQAKLIGSFPVRDGVILVPSADI